MKKNYRKVLKKFFTSKKVLRSVISILTVIAIYYSVMGSIFYLFLLPLIVMWLMGDEGVEFFNIYNSDEIIRTDISYFTLEDISDGIKILVIIAILVLAIILLKKIEKKLL